MNLELKGISIIIVLPLALMLGELWAIPWQRMTWQDVVKVRLVAIRFKLFVTKFAGE
jgi:hypothetical protein